MAQSEPNKKSVIILLSDGVNNAGVITPDEAIALAKSAGIPVYTVSLGTTTPTVLGSDWIGNPEYPGLNESALQFIADQTGGKYYKSVDEKTLKDVYPGLTPNTVRETEETSIKDYLIFGALVLLCAELWLRYGPGESSRECIRYRSASPVTRIRDFFVPQLFSPISRLVYTFTLTK